MKYELEIYQDFGSELGGKTTAYVFNKWDDVLARIQNKRDSEVIVGLREYHLVYKHPILLPPCEEINPFINKEVYNEFIKIPKEEIVTAKQSLYKDNFIEDEGFDNYCLTYHYLDKDTLFDLIYRCHTTFDLKNNDRKAIMHELYQHSRSNSIFNLRLYQYKKLPISDFK